TVNAGPTDDVALLQPTAGLTEGVRYRFRLDAPDGALAGAWTFRTEAPLHIVGTVPEDRTTEVPTNTGIEVQFDQDGTQAIESHFKIEPTTPGRFEQHERVWAFVPDEPLAAATIYTVTITPGLGVEGSSGMLEAGTTFRFETGVPTKLSTALTFGRPVLETRPGERPFPPLGEPLYNEKTDEPVIPKAAKVDVYRLPTFSAAVAAAQGLAGPDSWARYAVPRKVDTSGLTKVARVSGKVLNLDAGMFLRLLFEPQSGFYVVTIVQDGPPAELLLQVTNVAAYALTGAKDSVVWVNALATAKAPAGAAVAIALGASVGTRVAPGVAHVPTPTSLYEPAEPVLDRDPDPQILTVRAADGRGLILPLGLRTAWY